MRLGVDTTSKAGMGGSTAIATTAMARPHQFQWRCDQRGFWLVVTHLC